MTTRTELQVLLMNHFPCLSTDFPPSPSDIVHVTCDSHMSQKYILATMKALLKIAPIHQRDMTSVRETPNWLSQCGKLCNKSPYKHAAVRSPQPASSRLTNRLSAPFKPARIITIYLYSSHHSLIHFNCISPCSLHLCVIAATIFSLALD